MKITEGIRRLSMHPDEGMRWIYDSSHPEYNTPRARHLRDARAAAIRSAPEWLVCLARSNDAARDATAERVKPLTWNGKELKR